MKIEGRSSQEACAEPIDGDKLDTHWADLWMEIAV